MAKIVSENDQEIPQSETADNPWHREEEPLNHHETPGRQIKQSNQLSLQNVYCKLIWISPDHPLDYIILENQQSRNLAQTEAEL